MGLHVHGFQFGCREKGVPESLNDSTWFFRRTSHRFARQIDAFRLLLILYPMWDSVLMPSKLYPSAWGPTVILLLKWVQNATGVARPYAESSIVSPCRISFRSYTRITAWQSYILLRSRQMSLYRLRISQFPSTSSPSPVTSVPRPTPPGCSHNRQQARNYVSRRTEWPAISSRLP